VRDQGGDKHDDTRDVDEPDECEERNSDFAPTVMADKSAEAEEQRCGEQDIWGRDDEPYPPQPVPERFPVRMSADKSQRNEHSGGHERKRRSVVACLTHRREQTRRIRGDSGRFGGLCHRSPE
jgi:hypothetical protein